jgi:hypothetical protein
MIKALTAILFIVTPVAALVSLFALGPLAALLILLLLPLLAIAGVVLRLRLNPDAARASLAQRRDDIASQAK